MMKRKLIFTFTILLLVSVWFIHYYAPLFVVEIHNPVIETARATLYNKNEDLKRNTHSSVRSIKYYSLDSLSLKANIFLAEAQPAKANIILVHGIRSSKESFTPVALWLNKLGYNAIAIDLRAHGESQGQYCTYGYYEKQDISQLIDYLQEQEHLQGNFGIWGHSLGGAVSLQALATDTRLTFGIIESTYADFKTISKDYGKHYVGFEPNTLNDYILQRAGTIAHFPIDQVNPIDFAKRIQQPVLMIHGDNDRQINFTYGKQVYDQLSSKHKDFILVKNAGHNNLHQIGGQVLLNQIKSFIINLSN